MVQQQTTSSNYTQKQQLLTSKTKFTQDSHRISNQLTQIYANLHSLVALAKQPLFNSNQTTQLTADIKTQISGVNGMISQLNTSVSATPGIQAKSHSSNVVSSLQSR